MLQEIIQEIENGGNCVNLGRSLKGRKPHLYQWVIDQTPWIPEDAKYTERLYCLKHSITGPAMTDVGTVAKFINISEGYRKTDVKIRKEMNSKIRAEKEAEKAIERAEKEAKQQAGEAEYAKQRAEYYGLTNYTVSQIKSIDKVVKRTLANTAHLYEDDKIEGYDYVVCPVSKLRMVMIKSNYVENGLKINLATYDAMFPGIQKIANIRKENISKGLKQTDETTGLTKHQIATKKAKESLSAVDESGLSGYQKKGQKTRETHMSKVDENGMNGYKRIAEYRNNTITASGLTVQQEALIKRHNTLMSSGKSGTGGASKVSKVHLAPILDMLDALGEKYYFDQYEYRVVDTETGSIFSYDLTIPNAKIAIEYNSNAFHADPSMGEEEWRNWKPRLGTAYTPEEVQEYDMYKGKVLFRERGYRLFTVWENSVDTDICMIAEYLAAHYNI